MFNKLNHSTGCLWNETHNTEKENIIRMINAQREHEQWRACRVPHMTHSQSCLTYLILYIHPFPLLAWDPRERETNRDKDEKGGGVSDL